MSKRVVQTVAKVLEERQPDLAALIGDSPEYYAPRVSIAARLNMWLLRYAHEEDRLAFAGWLFDRPLRSTKDLTVAEGIAITRVLLDAAYEEFLDERQPAVLE